MGFIKDENSNIMNVMYLDNLWCHTTSGKSQFLHHPLSCFYVEYLLTLFYNVLLQLTTIVHILIVSACYYFWILCIVSDHPIFASFSQMNLFKLMISKAPLCIMGIKCIGFWSFYTWYILLYQRCQKLHPHSPYCDAVENISAYKKGAFEFLWDCSLKYSV